MCSMNRRAFNTVLPTTILGTCELTRISNLFAESGAANDQGSRAPFDLSVMLWTVFTDLPFTQRLEKIAEAGYRNVELVGEYDDWTEDDFKRVDAKRKELDITFDCTAGLKNGVANPDQREALLKEVPHTLSIMERLSCPNLIVLSGNRLPGMRRETQHRSCIDTLRAAAELVHGKSINGKPIRLFLETIDPEENPQYFLTEVAEALEVVQAVNCPQVQLLYDFFHEQISAGNLIAKLEKSISHLGLVHVADVPGRHEPGTGEINYANIFGKLAKLNYTGMVAMEFRPTGDPVTQLRTARDLALRAGSQAAHSTPSGAD